MHWNLALLRFGPIKPRKIVPVCLLMGMLLLAVSARADDAASVPRFRQTIETLSSLGDRSTGSQGGEAAAAHVKAELQDLYGKSVQSFQFSLPVLQYGKSTLEIPGRVEKIPIHPIYSNAVSPQTIPSKGIEAPLIYAGSGEASKFNGKQVEGAIVLMEMDSGRNWLNAASLGAKGLIYLDRGKNSKYDFKEKLELTPIHFPRFILSLDTARGLFGAFENAEDFVAPQIRLVSPQAWRLTAAENIYCLIPGTGKKLEEELVIVEAFYDSRAWVPGLSPGADEACSIATLLEIARFLKKNPPKRSVLLAATSGHAQSLAGMRELVWSVASRSKDLRDMKKQLKAVVSNTQQIIGRLEPSLKTGTLGESGDKKIDRLVREAVNDRIKTEVDIIARELMRLRLASKDIQQARIKELAEKRLKLRQIMWLPELNADALTEAQIGIMRRLLPEVVAEQQTKNQDAVRRLNLLKGGEKFRRIVKSKDLTASISLHMSSHGDGIGAFTKGWLYPLKSTINRIDSYSRLDEVVRGASAEIEKELGMPGYYKDTMRPSRIRPWQSYFLDRPSLGGEVSALAGYLGITLATTNDGRYLWGTPGDRIETVDLARAVRQSDFVCRLVSSISAAPRLDVDVSHRNGFSVVNGRVNFLRHGELFADQPAPGSVIMAFQGTTIYHAMVDSLGNFYLKGVADKKHVLHKVILEGYRFDAKTGEAVWAIDKEQTGKSAYRVKMNRTYMETDLIMFSCAQTVLFNLLEPRTFDYMTRIKLIDARREATPLRYWYSRIDTRDSILLSIFLEPGTRLKMTLSNSVLNKKMILLNASERDPQGKGYLVDRWPTIPMTRYKVAGDMWMLLDPRILNLEERGIHNERIRNLQDVGMSAYASAGRHLANRSYDRFFEEAAASWALASRVYNDVEQTQKDVLWGVLFYIAMFVPFAFCLERFLFGYADIYRRLIAFCLILIALIALIYNVHPAFRLAYSPMVVILAFFIIGLSAMVTLIIFFRFETEMGSLQSRSQQRYKSAEIGHWRAFSAAFFLGVSNLRRRRLRTIFTCATLIILTFTIMSFTTVKTLRRHGKLEFANQTPYHGILLKNVNWSDFPREAYQIISNTFSRKAVVAPRAWMEDEDRTRATRVPLKYENRTFEAQGVIGLSPMEPRVSGIEKILSAGRWFQPGEERAVVLSMRMAETLGIDLEQLENTRVSIWGIPFRVTGVFSGERLQQLNDLDGEALTPAIFPEEISTEMTEVEMDALESGEDVRSFQSRYQHIPSELTFIMPYKTLMSFGGHLKALAVGDVPEDTIEKVAQALVDRFGVTLFSGEKNGTYIYNASDTLSYSGVPNIVIPMVISILIVLNTMIGSVYERKNEIGIYTSVGLAPSHVSFLFVAEAVAFAVLSVVLGYLLAQTTARFFADTPLWSGITVNYSSMAGVGAMLMVIGVVLISVIYPSKVAGDIAIPDVKRSWKMPPSEGNVINVTLPFLLKQSEYRSVADFLYEFFDSHQDVSHGLFSTADLSTTDRIRENPHELDGKLPADDWPSIQMSAKVWLAPFDFGIMQRAVVRFEQSKEQPGYLQIVLRLVREAGEANAWRRANKGFLLNMRKQLLIWRSIDETSHVTQKEILS